MKDWPRYAEALDMRLGGASIGAIAEHFGVTKQRAGQMVTIAKAQLAFRVFKGLPRPLPVHKWLLEPSPRPLGLASTTPRLWCNDGAE